MTEAEKKLIRLFAAGYREYKKEVDNIYDRYAKTSENCTEMQYARELHSPIPDMAFKLELRHQMGLDKK